MGHAEGGFVPFRPARRCYIHLRCWVGVRLRANGAAPAMYQFPFNIL